MLKMVAKVLFCLCVPFFVFSEEGKTALIFGVTGQDGAYLSDFLLEKGYTVHGVKRRSSSHNTARIDHHYQDPHEPNQKFILHYGDLTDSLNVVRLIQEISPDEIYNLGAQSHVKVSFEIPEYTAEVDALGTLRILEAIRFLRLQDKTRFYQASTSELYGLVQEVPQSEQTPFYPRSPYGCAKLYGYWITINYREAYNMYACNGILFNHESPLRGQTFVTKKITQAVANIKYGLQDTLFLGNLDAMRDWGYAKDYVEAMWLMLQQNSARDYVIASGEEHSVREFVTLSFQEAGIDIEWSGKGLDEIGRDKATQKTVVQVDSRYFRPAEVDRLLGDNTLAKRQLGWEPKTRFKDLITLMVQDDLKQVQKNMALK